MKKNLLFIVVMLWAVAAPAQMSIPVKEYALKNGLRVLFIEEHKAPVATFQVWYRVGSRLERIGKTGLSHMMEHMMFKGTQKIGPREFSKIVQSQGGIDNAYTTQDYTTFYENFASDRLELSLKLESDRMQNLALLDKEFQSERLVVKEERRMRYEDDPVHAVVEQMMATAFQIHPYRWPVIGWMQDIDRYKIEDLQNWYHTYYVPNNAFLVIAGDVDPEVFIKKVREYFEPIPSRPVPPQTTFVEPPQRGERRVFLKKEAKLPFVFAGYHTPNQSDPDSFSLDVLAVVLSGGKSSRLYQSLVYQKQLATFAEGEYDRVSHDPELFYVYAEALPGVSVDKVEQALYEEIEKLKKEPVPPTELQKAKNQIEADFIQSQDSIFDLAGELGRYEACSSWKDWEKYLPGIQAVTPKDLLRVAAKYLTEDNRTVGILIPQAEKDTSQNEEK